MRWFFVTDILETLRPVYLASNILLINFTTYNFKTRTVHRTLFDLIRFACTFVLDVYLSYRAILGSLPFLTGTDSIFINTGRFGSISLNILLCASIPLWNNLNGIAIFQMLECMAICNDELKELGVWMDLWKRHLVFTMLSILSASVGFSTLIVNWFFPSLTEVVTVRDMFVDRWTIVAFSRTYFIMGISNCCNTLTLLALRKHYSLLNETIVKYFPTNTHPNTSNSKLGSVQLIKKLAALHDLLNRSVRLFNRCFASQLLIHTCSGFGFTLFSLFGVIHTFTIDSSEADRRIAMIHMSFAWFLLLFVVMFVVCSSLVNAESQGTAVVIHKAVAYGSYEKETLNELRALSQQLLYIPVISCGMIDFNWDFFYTFLGTLISYLVILLQFDLANLKLV